MIPIPLIFHLLFLIPPHMSNNLGDSTYPLVLYSHVFNFELSNLNLINRIYMEDEGSCFNNYERIINPFPPSVLIWHR